MTAGGPNILPDAGDRRAAAGDFSRNLVVVAGAGTGKTSLLVERALVALGAGRATIGRLAAITFTEKAAGQLRDKLADGLERLRALASDEPPAGEATAADRAFAYLVADRSAKAPEVAARALTALREIDRARLTTIHSFCAELLREHPVEARVAPDFEVDDGGHARAVLTREWAGFVEAELGADAPRVDLWGRVLGRVPLGRVRAVAERLSGFDIPLDVVAPGRQAATAEELFGREASDLVKRIESVLDRGSGMTPKAVAYFRAAARALAALEAGGLDLLQETVRNDPDLQDRIERKALGVPKKLAGITAEEYEEAFEGSRRLLKALRIVEDGLIRDVIDVVSPFARSFRETVLRRGHVSFDGLLVLARDLLRDHPTVRESLKRRYRLLLVDEFQDTDPLQYEIVLFLAEEEERCTPDAYAARLAPGRLFIVGDPKQSIYRFRGADYSAFMRALGRIEPDETKRLHLVTNFRSVPGLLGPINDLFRDGSGGAWAPSEYQPEYEAIKPAREETADGPRVEVWTADPGADRRAPSRRDAEGRAIAAGIRRLVEEEKACGYGEIFILMRTFTNLSRYLRPLREAEIPFVVDGGRGFLERVEVVQLLATLRALARPADAAMLLAFLRSPVGGVPDAELTAFAVEGGAWNRGARVDPERFPNTARAYGLLQELAEEARRLPADLLVRRVMARMSFLPLGAFAYEGAQRVANLRKIAAAAAELARDGRLTINEVLDALEEEGVGDVKAESPLADETGDAVRVLTVHRAKGLQSRVVFVADLAWERGGAGRRREVGAGTIRPAEAAPSLALDVDGLKNAARVWLERETERHEDAEEVRTLYVALTRARDRLIVLGGRAKRNAPWASALAPWGYDTEQPPGEGELLNDGKVLHRLVAPSAEVTRVSPGAPADVGDAVAGYERAVTEMRARARPPMAHPSGLREERDLRRDAEDEPRSRGSGKATGVGRSIGTVAHRLLEQWDLRDDASLLAPLGEVSRDAAEDDGVQAAEVERGAKEVLSAFLASPLAGRLRGMKILGRETPMLLHDEERTTWRGSIDLVYRDDDGGVVVADYKTDADDTRAAELYAQQLAVYARAVRRALGLEELPRAELWMIRTGRVIRVPVTDPPPRNSSA